MTDVTDRDREMAREWMDDQYGSGRRELCDIGDDELAALLAQARAEGAAGALREAADVIQADAETSPPGSGQKLAMVSDARLLRAEADRIEDPDHD